MPNLDDTGLSCLLDGRSYVVDDPDDSEQPCPHGDYRSCVVDGCRPLRRVHVAGVIRPPAPGVACMWCGEDSPRGQCVPCAGLLDAIHAASRAGITAIVDATRPAWEMQPREGAQIAQSPAWWAEHTVVRLVVTHLNEHGARVLFSLPGRGIDLIAETPEQAARQLAYARERWPEGVYEICEARFWREADGRPGNPVHIV